MLVGHCSTECSRVLRQKHQGSCDVSTPPSSASWTRRDLVPRFGDLTDWKGPSAVDIICQVLVVSCPPLRGGVPSTISLGFWFLWHEVLDSDNGRKPTPAQQRVVACGERSLDSNIWQPQFGLCRRVPLSKWPCFPKPIRQRGPFPRRHIWNLHHQNCFASKRPSWAQRTSWAKNVAGSVTTPSVSRPPLHVKARSRAGVGMRKSTGLLRCLLEWVLETLIWLRIRVSAEKSPFDTAD